MVEISLSWLRRGARGGNAPGLLDKELASISFSLRRAWIQFPQQLGDGFTSEPGRVLRHVRGLGNGVEPGCERYALVKDQIHDVAAARLAEHLEQEP